MRAVPLTQLAMGINRLRTKGGASPNGLYDLLNAYVTAAGTVVPREGTIRAATLTNQTVGLAAMNGIFNVFATSLQAVPAGYVCNILVNPNNAADTLKKVWFAQPFMGFLYVVAEFTSGAVYHYWLQSDGTWAADTVYKTSSIMLPTVPNGLAYQAERNIAANPTWAPDIVVALNSIVEPTEYTGYMYKAIAVAGTSPHTGSVEPTWPTVSNGTVQEFGDFSTSSTSSVTSGGSTSAQTLGTTITDRYGNSADVAGQTGTAALTTETVPMASTTIGQWAAGTLFAPGAVVMPSTGQGAFINAIPNGDFEAGNDGNWTLGTGWSILNDGHAYQGNWYAAFSHTGSGFFDTTMTNGAAVTAGQSVTVNGYAQGDSDGQICLTLNWYDGTNTLISTTKGALGNGGGGSGNPPNYGPVSVTGVAPANAKTVKAGFEYQTGSSSARAGRVDLLSWNLETPAAVSSFLYEAVQANPATSGSSEPAWPTTEGNEVTDGGVTWKAIGTSIITWEALPIMQSGAVEPTWPTVVGGSVYDGNMSWTAISRQITDKNCPNTKQVCLGASHVFAGDNDIVAYCAAVNPTDWTSANNAGYLPTGLNNYGANPVACLGLYRSNLIVLNSGGYQMWQIDPDPANMALLDAEPVGSIYTRGAQSAGNDMLFTTEVGIRNIGVAGATANLQVGSTGQPVDPIVLPLLKAATYDPISLYYPGRGQFWDIWGSLALVMTMNGAGQKTWSRYVFPDVITDWTLNAGVLYLRSAGNLVWQLDPDTLVDDANGTTSNQTVNVTSATFDSSLVSGFTVDPPSTFGTNGGVDNSGIRGLGTLVGAYFTIQGGGPGFVIGITNSTALSKNSFASITVTDGAGVEYTLQTSNAIFSPSVGADVGGQWTWEGFTPTLWAPGSVNPVIFSGLSSVPTETPFQGIIQWPYLDAGALGINKMLVGVDIVGDGQVSIQIGFNQADKTSFDDNAGFATSPSVTPPYTVTAADTVPGEPIPIPVTAPSYSLILTFAGNQAWTLEAANLYMAPIGGAGATG